MLKNTKPNKQSLIHDVISRYFLCGMWQNMLLIGVIEIILQAGCVVIFKTEIFSWKILHLVGWSLWSIFCLAKVVRSNRYNGS